jgi:hypothetical protein
MNHVGFRANPIRNYPVPNHSMGNCSSFPRDKLKVAHPTAEILPLQLRLGQAVLGVEITAA